MRVTILGYGAEIDFFSFTGKQKTNGGKNKQNSSPGC